jgi:hypothetical protein
MAQMHRLHARMLTDIEEMRITRERGAYFKDGRYTTASVPVPEGQAFEVALRAMALRIHARAMRALCAMGALGRTDFGETSDDVHEQRLIDRAVRRQIGAQAAEVDLSGVLIQWRDPEIIVSARDVCDLVGFRLALDLDAALTPGNLREAAFEIEAEDAA